MEQSKNRGGRPRAASRYPRTVMTYETEAGARLAELLARRRGTSVAALLRQLLREEAARLGVPAPEEDP